MSGTTSSNIGYQRAPASRVQSRTYSQGDDDDLIDSSICGGLCCKPGLIIGILTCVYLIFLLPCGLFAMMVVGPRNYIFLLAGAGAVFLPPLAFLLGCLIVFCKRRYKKRSIIRHRQMTESPTADYV